MGSSAGEAHAVAESKRIGSTIQERLIPARYRWGRLRGSSAGFQPLETNLQGGFDAEGLRLQRISSVASWLPATEMFGEGFLRGDPDHLGPTSPTAASAATSRRGSSPRRCPNANSWPVSAATGHGAEVSPHVIWPNGSGTVTTGIPCPERLAVCWKPRAVCWKLGAVCWKLGGGLLEAPSGSARTWG